MGLCVGMYKQHTTYSKGFQTVMAKNKLVTFKSLTVIAHVNGRRSNTKVRKAILCL